MSGRLLKLPGFDFAADVDESIRALRDSVPPDGAPYYGLFSGGKDSVALKAVAELAGVPVRWFYNVTTIDPPEIIRFIKLHHSDVQWVRPEHGNFFRRAEVIGFPTRRNRWCCREYKEGQSPPDETLLMGLRGQESWSRASRWEIVSEHWRTGQPVVSPLYRWDAEDLWDFIRDHGIPYSSLYDEGWDRVGCIGCPMSREAGKRRDFARWPRYEALWKRTFRRIWERRSGKPTRDGRPWFGDVYFDRWEPMWEWWVSNAPLPEARIVEP